MVARDGLTFHHPLPTERKVRMLDLGSGTGMYPVHVAE